MLGSIILSRAPGSPLVSTILCCFVSLLVWTVAVVGVHHVRLSSSHMDSLFGGSGDALRAMEAAANYWQQQQQPMMLGGQLHADPVSSVSLSRGDERLSSLASSWPLESSYRMELSTEDNYQVPPAGTSSQQQHQQTAETSAFCGIFADIRRDLDHIYHKAYECRRQHFQDKIIESKLASAAATTTTTTTTTAATTTTATVTVTARDTMMGTEADTHNHGTTTTAACDAPDTKGSRRNWIVFTAGVMGAGKSYTIKKLHEKGRFPLNDFVTVDPDSVRRLLPEFERYVKVTPEKAGEFTRKESGMISEILTEAALRRGQNVLVDGTLRNSTWYQAYFDDLRERYPSVKIGILHITAPREAVLERAMSRAKVTGRIVPRDLLEHTMVEVPHSIKILSAKVDFAVQLQNAPGSSDVEIVTEGVTWTSFTRMWMQSCALSTPEEVPRMDFLSFQREKPPVVRV